MPLQTDELLLVTGARGGIGRAVVAAARSQGLQVAGVSRRLHGEPPAPDLVEIEADVSTAAGADLALSAVAEACGAPPTLLCHAVGNVRLGAIERTADAAWSEVLRANLDSAFYTLRAWSRVQGTQPAAAVLFSSVAARLGTPAHVAVAAAKGGLEALVRALASDLAPRGHRVNALALGLTETPLARGFLGSERSRAGVSAQYPLGRIGQADEVAAQALWLLSPQSAWITGQVLAVDGGFSAIRPLVRS